MKNRYTLYAIALVAAVLFALPSCDKVVADNLKYDLDMETGSIDITIPPISDTTLNATLGTATSTYNFDSAIKASTADKLSSANIGSAKMVSCKLTLVYHNDSNNFANFQNTSVTFFTNSNTTPFTVASITNNPDAYAETLDLPVDSTTEMKSYLSGSSLTYSLMGKMRRGTTDSIVCRVQLKMKVSVHS